MIELKLQFKTEDDGKEDALLRDLLAYIPLAFRCEVTSEPGGLALFGPATQWRVLVTEAWFAAAEMPEALRTFDTLGRIGRKPGELVWHAIASRMASILGVQVWASVSGRGGRWHD